MENRILKFLDVIDFDQDKRILFEEAELIDVLVDVKNKKWTINIAMDELIPIDIFSLMCEKSKNIKQVDKVLFNFNIKNNDKFLKEYFLYYFEILKEKCPSLLSINTDNIIFSSNEINISVINEAENKKIKSLIKKINKFLDNMGFNNIVVITTLNSSEREKFVSEIKASLDSVKNKSNENAGPKLILGSPIKTKASPIKNIIAEDNSVTLEVFIFGKDVKFTSKGYIIVSLKISDYSDSIMAKLFLKETEIDFEKFDKDIIEGKWYKLKGYVKHDTYMNDLVFNIRDIESLEKRENKRYDDAENKRVELHLHTSMSQMDGLIDYKKLLSKINTLGHRAVGITDKNSIQIFPKLYKNKGDIKVLFGAEIFAIDDEVKIITKETEEDLMGEIVVFDLETTGFNAFGTDSIIEIGAVKIKNGVVIDRFDELINPGTKLRSTIVNLTNITDSMLKNKDNESVVVKKFMQWVGSLPMIAHNAKFDTSFIKSAFQKYSMGEFNNTVIDTLEISRAMNPDETHHNLSALVKRYNVEFDENAHHRADYDAEATAIIYTKMMKSLGSSYKKIKDLVKLINKENLIKTVRPFHMTVFAKNNDGLKNLFKIISYTNTTYFYKTPRIPKSVLSELKEGLLYGSGCNNGEIFEAAKTKSTDDLINLMNFYDFIEVNPPSILKHLVETGEFTNELELKENIKKIISTAESVNKIVCATGDVHTLDPDDNIYREILVTQRQPGGGLHPLNRQSIKTIPNAFLMTTNEMLEEFEFLGKEKAFEIVVTNTNKIADIIEDVEVVKHGLYAPKMENSAETMKNIVYTNARNTYGEKLPEIIEERLDKELTGIISGEYDVIYLIAQKLVENSNKNGYIVGSRGSVGSSLVATFLNITEVNPLPAHYVCPKCKKSIFEIKGEKLSSKYGSGFDMPERICECGTRMNKQGQDIPFETFLGFNADKTPDIDLNFSGEYQAKAHEYTKVLFGEENVYRAGTVTTIAEKTAFGFVKHYLEEKGVTLRRVEIERLAKGITGIKRTSGQHPGGIIVIPRYKDVFDFTPFQYPAENVNSAWKTTHFEFHDIEENVLKLDILGHDDPTVLKYLMDDIKIDINDIPLDDTEVLSLFSSTKALKIKPEDIGYEVGTLGVPEFGTNFVIKMLEEIRPKTFAELIKISGLSHGTDVWNGNARDLLLNKTCEFKEVIGCRDDIMLYLINCGIDKGQSFKISEFIRKGKTHKEPDTWKDYKEILKEHKVPTWYMESCEKIKYMFPKAHASAYVTNGFRVAWFKLHHPLNYYRVFLSIRRSDFDIESMIKGHESVKTKIKEIEEKGFDSSDKEDNVLQTLKVANEMFYRGFYFENISLEKSDATMFKINDEKTALIPPFTTLEGMGDIAAKKLVSERDNKMFISIEDVQLRGKVSTALLDKMRALGILNNLPESSQLSLF